MLVNDQKVTDLCEAFRNSSPSSAEPIRKILMVGAEQSSAGELSDQDYMYLYLVMRTFQNQGIAVDPDVEIETVNLNKGEDFLEGKYDADMVMLCHIFNPRTKYDAPEPGTFNASAQHFADNAWANAIVNTKAQYTAIFPAGDTLPDLNACDIFSDETNYKIVEENPLGNSFDLLQRQQP